MKTIMDLPAFLEEMKKFLKNPERQVSNHEMGSIMTWMLTGVSAEKAAEWLENMRG